MPFVRAVHVWCCVMFEGATCGLHTAKCCSGWRFEAA